MADTVDSMKLDASQMMSELAKLITVFKNYQESVGSTANITIDLTKKSKSLKTEFELTNAEGIKISGTLKKVNGEYQAVAKSIRQTTDALTQAKKAQQELNIEQARVKAQALIAAQTQVNAAPVPDKNIAALRTAQSKLIQALAQDFKGQDAQAIAAEMFDKIRQGTVVAEAGIRGKLQAAVVAVLNAERSITAELDKQIRLGNQQSTNKVVLQRQTEAAQAAQKFIDTTAGVSGQIPSQNLNTLRAAQAKLARALGEDLAKNVPLANTIFENLKKGILSSEPAAQKLQAALIQVLRVSEQIDKTQKKLATPLAPTGTVQPGQLAALRQNLGEQFRIPTGASIQSVISLQTAINNLINTAAKGKVFIQ